MKINAFASLAVVFILLFSCKNKQQTENKTTENTKDSVQKVVHKMYIPFQYNQFEVSFMEFDVLNYYGYTDEWNRMLRVSYLVRNVGTRPKKFPGGVLFVPQNNNNLILAGITSSRDQSANESTVINPMVKKRYIEYYEISKDMNGTAFYILDSNTMVELTQFYGEVISKRFY